MKTTFQLPLLLLSVLLMTGTSLAQTPQLTEASLHLLGRYHAGKMLLRWAPANPEAWRTGNEQGYRLERLELSPGQKPDPEKFISLNSQPVQAQPLTEWVALSGRYPDNQYLLVAAECLHGDPNRQAGMMQGDWLSAADELMNRYSMAIFAAEMDFTAAQASGLAWIDESVEPGKRYAYRLSFANQPGQDSESVIQILEAKTKPLLEPKIASVSEEEGRIVLHWNRSYHQAHYSAWYIEQSHDGHSFSPINTEPYVHALGEDDRLQTQLISFSHEVKNYQPVMYRLVGVNSFGQLSPPSVAVSAMGRDRTPPAQPGNVLAHPDPEEKLIRLKWESEASDLAGFKVFRTFEFHGEMLPLVEQMLPPESRSLVDQNPNFVGINYYQVVAVDTAGNETPSRVVPGFIEDLDPPKKPTGLRGTVDTNGVVQLNWPVHPEPDVRGYRVYFANAKTEVFASLTNRDFADTIFLDTISLQTLSRQVHYRIIAVDRRGNLSPFSDILTLERPDVIPPVAPLFREFEAKEEVVGLDWIPSCSRDVKEQRLFRRKVEETDWKRIGSFPFDQSYFLDQEVKAGQRYQYQLVAVDRAGLEGISPVLAVRTPAARLMADQKLRLRADSKAQSLQLQWQAIDEPLIGWIVYRAEDEGPFRTYRSLNPEVTSLEDRSLKQGVTYRYVLRAVSPDGSKSPLSREVSQQL